MCNMKVLLSKRLGAYSGAGTDIGAKYPTSSARRRSSRKSKLAGEAAAVARERMSKRSNLEDDSLMEEEEVVTMATAQPGSSTWSSWLFGSANQLEENTDDTDGGLSLAAVDDDADEDNIGLWLVSWVTSFFALLLSPFYGIFLLYCFISLRR